MTAQTFCLTTGPLAVRLMCAAMGQSCDASDAGCSTGNAETRPSIETPAIVS